MASTWIGSIVSVDCGDVLGIFEGSISSVDGVNQTISLINVSRNSVKCQVPEITLSTHDIKKLKFLESTVNKTNANNNESIQNSTLLPRTTANGNTTDSPNVEDNQKKKGEGKKKTKNVKKWQKEKDEAFSAPVDSEVLDIDFDFEKNLALFDKRAVFEEIEALSKLDHVKLVDCNKRGQAKYRHDENILSCDIPILKQISVPCKSEKEYVTDTGLVVPSVTVKFKKMLFEKATHLGITRQLRTEMMGRSACEMVLHLVGGSHRLNPENMHQKPIVLILCGIHDQGVQGVNCGRQLCNHNVAVTVICPPLPSKNQSSFLSELNLFNISGGTVVHTTSELPTCADIIIDALDSQEEKEAQEDLWNGALRQWSKQCKAPVLSLDPPPDCDSTNYNFILCPALPYFFKNEKCSVHICDIGIPKGLFTSLNCTYSSPFGSRFVVSLYSTSP